jgi:hypothetical protein
LDPFLPEKPQGDVSAGDDELWQNTPKFFNYQSLRQRASRESCRFTTPQTTTTQTTTADRLDDESSAGNP